jgi:hypothetical protein
MAWRKITVLAAGVAGAMLLASPAHAAVDPTIPLNDAHTNITAPQFGTKDCTGPFADLAPGKDGWHFVLPAVSGDDFVSVTLTFNSGGSNFDVVIDAIAPLHDFGAGWEGWIDDAGSSGSFRHAYVITDAGWTLIDGEAVVTGPGADGAPGDEFNLSHVCVGTPPTTPPGTPTTVPATTTPPTTTTTTMTTTNGGPSRTTTIGGLGNGGGGGAPAAGGAGSGSLPVTGVALGGMLLTGLALVGGGVALVVLRRRRDAAPAPVDVPPVDEP